MTAPQREHKRWCWIGYQHHDLPVWSHVCVSQHTVFGPHFHSVYQWHWGRNGCWIRLFALQWWPSPLLHEDNMIFNYNTKYCCHKITLLLLWLFPKLSKQSESVPAKQNKLDKFTVIKYQQSAIILKCKVTLPYYGIAKSCSFRNKVVYTQTTERDRLSWLFLFPGLIRVKNKSGWENTGSAWVLCV